MNDRRAAAAIVRSVNDQSHVLHQFLLAFSQSPVNTAIFHIFFNFLRPICDFHYICLDNKMQIVPVLGLCVCQSMAVSVRDLCVSVHGLVLDVGSVRRCRSCHHHFTHAALTSLSGGR